MKIKKVFFASMAVLLLFSSCLKEDEKVLDSYAAITAFSIGNFKVWYNDINIQGRDTLVYRLEGGAMYPMTIDQHNRLIYNVDSISYGAKIDRLTVQIEHTGYAYLKKKREDGTTIDTLWSGSDSLDFTKPVVFTILSQDLKERREYTVQLNMHKIHPDSMTWSQRDTVGYKALKDQSSLIKNDSIYLFGKDETGTPVLVKRSIVKNTNWLTPVALNGINADLWNSNIILYNEMFYQLQDGQLYFSDNAVDWNQSPAAEKFKYLVSSSNSEYSEGVCWAVNEAGEIVKSENMINWELYQTNVSSFPDRNISACCYPLKSNPQILRTVLVGIDDDYPSMKASVWTRLSTDSVWTEITPSATNDKLLPAKGGLTMIRYDKDLYAFGNGFNAFYQSKDNGVTWRDCSLLNDEYSTWNIYMKFPMELFNKLTKFSSVTDSNNTIWIMTETGQVWRGGINRLMK